MFRESRKKGNTTVIRKFKYAVGLCALISPVAHAAIVSVPEKSQPESITVAPNGDLILGSAASAASHDQRVTIFLVTQRERKQFRGLSAPPST